MEWFHQLLSPLPEPVQILDVGGTPEYWREHGASLPKRCAITVLNLNPSSAAGIPNLTTVTGDARKMDAIADGAFAVCFCNSVIEHVGTLYDQMAMAAEIRRVAKAYFVQTPYRYFPVEAHFLVPCWQFLPLGLRALFHRHWRLGWMAKQPEASLARAEVEQIRLLDLVEMRFLFPDAVIRKEKVGPFTKSLVALSPVQ